MIRVKKRFGFTLDEERLRDVCLTAYNAATNRTGIFARGIERFLPQYHLPPELEFYPRKEKPKEVLTASNYLWTCVFFERINQSRIIIRNALRTWNTPSKRWIFNPRQVQASQLSDVEQILANDFQFNLHGKNEERPAKRFKDNAAKLIKEYDGDPRNIVNYDTVAQARKNLREFKGIGTGIANLFIIYLMDRELAKVRDPENVLLKVDVHKGRIPINTNAITPKEKEIYRDDVYVRVLEDTYCAICQENKLDPSNLDRALWVIGSEVCSRQDVSSCHSNCPLYEMCESFTPEDKTTGRYTVFEKDGKRIDDRKNKGQTHFHFH